MFLLFRARASAPVKRTSGTITVTVNVTELLPLEVDGHFVHSGETRVDLAKMSTAFMGQIQPASTQLRDELNSKTSTSLALQYPVVIVLGK